MDIPTKRKGLINTLLPGGIPRLWCPLLTHYRDDGSIDFPRMTAHVTHMVPWIKGYLVPGSTGDGWELTREETTDVLAFAVQTARQHEVHLLLGVLKTDTDTMEGTIAEMLNELHGLTGIRETLPCLLDARVSGVTVTPPKGASLDQATLYRDLSHIAEKGLPMALYQLPQVTDNELAPETFERLVAHHENIIFFKDSSGNDGIARADIDSGGVYLVRGAEGDYARWPKDAGGPYDGFLLSTANCFPSELAAIIALIEGGTYERARSLSERLTAVIDSMFALVQTVPCGNAFTNANKAMDHYFAFGPTASRKAGPMLHGGARISKEIISKTEEILVAYGFMPEKGYLE